MRTLEVDEIERALAEAEKIRNAIEQSRQAEIERIIKNKGKGDRRKRRKQMPKGKKKYGW